VNVREWKPLRRAAIWLMGKLLHFLYPGAVSVHVVKNIEVKEEQP